MWWKGPPERGRALRGPLVEHRSVNRVNGSLARIDPEQVRGSGRMILRWAARNPVRARECWQTGPGAERSGFSSSTTCRIRGTTRRRLMQRRGCVSRMAACSERFTFQREWAWRRRGGSWMGRGWLEVRSQWAGKQGASRRLNSSWVRDKSLRAKPANGARGCRIVQSIYSRFTWRQLG